MKRRNIIISNGFNKFHLAFAAESLAAADKLGCLLTASYPTTLIKRLIQSLGLERHPPLRRLIDREVNVPSHLIRDYWVGELAWHAGMLARSHGSNRWFDILSCIGMRIYAAQAAADVRRFSPTSSVYHYRAGFGGRSVRIAKKQGLLALCDHSAVHPKLYDWLASGGDENEIPENDDISESWRIVLNDIEMADHVVVNSDFVKHTFQLAGADTSNVHVIYLGIDEEFARALTIDDIAEIKANKHGAAPTILFAGRFSEHKGAFEVIEALESIRDLDWQFSIAGAVEPRIASAHPEFFSSSRVRQLGWMSRRDLARVMAEADIFLFPSRAEGSARVIFEALASGCFVITTKSSGSIVEEGKHGSIVPSSDSTAIGRALSGTLVDICGARRIGMQNAALVRSEFSQLHYGRALNKLYEELSLDRS